VVAAGGLGLAAWLVAGAAAVVGRRWWAGRAYLGRAVRTTPRAIVGLTLAHLGLGLVTLGITGVTAWHSDKVLSMRPGDTVAFAGRTITLSALENANGPNYEARRARFTVKGAGAPYEMRSERRFYPSAQSQTTEAGIRVRPLGNLYVSVGEESDQGIVVRLWNHPLIVWNLARRVRDGDRRGGVAQRPASEARRGREGADHGAATGGRRMRRLLFLAPIAGFFI
jgi:cytochrome c-type biogenesis protein CcmF